MKKLRIFALAIVVLLTLSALVACAGNNVDVVPVNPSETTVTTLPTMTFDDETPKNNTLVIAVTNKGQTTLPQYVAKNRFGKEMDNSAVTVTHMFDGAVDNSVTYKAGASRRNYYAVGQHTFIFVVTDNTNSALVNYYYVYLTVYQSLFKILGNRDVLQDELSNSPTLRTNDPGFALSWFNLERSDVYYAEATFDSVDKEENNGRDWAVGLLHATDEDGRQQNHHRHCACGRRVLFLPKRATYRQVRVCGVEGSQDFPGHLPYRQRRGGVPRHSF